MPCVIQLWLFKTIDFFSIIRGENIDEYSVFRILIDHNFIIIIIKCVSNIPIIVVQFYTVTPRIINLTYVSF